jgi:hypothetical protein
MVVLLFVGARAGAETGFGGVIFGLTTGFGL